MTYNFSAETPPVGIKTLREYKKVHDKWEEEVRCQQCSHIRGEHMFNFVGDLRTRTNDDLDWRGFEYCNGADSVVQTGTTKMTAKEVYNLVKCPCKEFRPFKKNIEVSESTYDELTKVVAERGGVDTIEDIIMERVDAAYRKIREDKARRGTTAGNE